MLAIGLLHWLLRRRLTGAGPLVWEFVFYATFGVVVTSSVAIAGVLLVFSFLIIPAAIGVMFASSLGRQLAIGWIAGTLTSAAGLAASFAFDLPTGAAMVCAFGASLGRCRDALPVSCAATARTRCASRSQLHAGVVAAILAGSALQLAAAPRADQPLIDLAEYAVPSLRALYFTPTEQATFADASAYAERYRMEAEQLNDLERRNRTEGEALDDFSRRADLLVPEILRRNAQGRAIRDGRSARAGARACSMEREPGLAAARAVAACPGCLAASLGTAPALNASAPVATRRRTG